MRPLAITSLGAYTPLGHRAVETFAALRAGLSAMSPLDGVVDSGGGTPIGCRVPDLDPRALEIERLLGMMRQSLADALTAVTPPQRAHLHIALLLAERHEGRAGALVDGLRAALPSLGVPADTPADVYALGHAAGFQALVDAETWLASGTSRSAVLLGADSLVELTALAALDAQGRLKSASQPRGVIPGEAGACVVLRSSEAVASAEVPVHAWIRGAAVATEPAPVGADAPLLGLGLTRAIRGALDAACWRKEDVPRVYADLNGEGYRHHEWTLALLRTLGDPELIHPADCLGDIGAASGPLLLGMVATALRRGYARAPRALVFCSSDGGLRGAACLSRT